MTRARDKANSTVTNFVSTGIDDNASSTVLTANTTGIDVTGNITSQGSGYARLDLNGTTGGELRLQKSGTTYADIYADSTDGLTVDVAASNQILFKDSGTERMRIDSSGNLLVGGTSADAATSTTIYSNGQIRANTSSINVAILDRRDSDGGILEFKKDDTTVGSIGVNSGGTYFAGNGSSLLSVGDAVVPRSTTGGSRNGVVDLGNSANLFKDLYLSGTLVANTVDLGNWTITESGGVLFFATSGTNKMKLDASGNLTVVGDVTAFGSV